MKIYEILDLLFSSDEYLSFTDFHILDINQMDKKLVTFFLRYLIIIPSFLAYCTLY